MQRERWLLVIPPGLELLGDISATLWGQPAEYWDSGFDYVYEVNPIGFYLLGIHPAAFVASALAYLFIFAVAIFILPERWAFLVSLALLIAHASGTNSWLLILGSLYEGTHNLLAATVAAVCYHTYFLRTQEPDAAISANNTES
jgi:hypothetical protein